MKVLVASLRMALALVCVGVSLIMSGQYLGLFPDVDTLILQSRQKQCESIAIYSAAMIRDGKWDTLRAILNATAARDDELLSIGIRSRTGHLRLETGEHSQLWRSGSGAVSEVQPVVVPITLNRRPWGTIEYCYRPLYPSDWAQITMHPLMRLVALFAAAGLAIYSFMIGRMLSMLNSGHVVPERVSRALDTLAEGLLVLDENERIVLANAAFCKTVGETPENLAGRLAGELPWIRMHSGDGAPLPWTRAIEEMTPQIEEIMQYQLADDSRRIFSINSTPIQAGDGTHRGALATFRDVTQIEEHRAELETMLTMLRSSRDEITRKNRELEILATQDALTSCLNRRAFFERFEHLWSQALEQNKPLACIMIDNDHFKRINDTYGHAVGDEVLRQVSSLLRKNFSDGLVCRYGGEEFVVVLAGHDIQAAAERAERLRKELEQVRLEDPPELRISASIGVSERSLGAAEPQDLINESDQCLYVAKKQGRNRVVEYQPEYANIEQEPDADRNEEIAAATSNTQSVPFQAVTALLSALAYREAGTAEHSRRVADLCVMMAGSLLKQRETYILEIAALLHDIGKIGVPDNVLLKPDKLTSDEWKLMREHDRIGVEIVASTFDCPELSEMIRTYRAFYGGDSRSSHLPKGNEIPLGARILSICDSYDSMTTDRAYRKGCTHQAAVEELRRCAGTQFDPELVERFVVEMQTTKRASRASEEVLPKQVALEIGVQIERLADAIDHRDSGGLRSLASRLSEVANNNGIHSIAEVAVRLRDHAAQDDVQWMIVLRETQQLLNLCRSTQNAFLIGQSPSSPVAGSCEAG